MEPVKFEVNLTPDEAKIAQPPARLRQRMESYSDTTTILTYSRLQEKMAAAERRRQRQIDRKLQRVKDFEDKSRRLIDIYSKLLSCVQDGAENETSSVTNDNSNRRNKRANAGGMKFEIVFDEKSAPPDHVLQRLTGYKRKPLSYRKIQDKIEAAERRRKKIHERRAQNARDCDERCRRLTEAYEMMKLQHEARKRRQQGEDVEAPFRNWEIAQVLDVVKDDLNTIGLRIDRDVERTKAALFENGPIIVNPGNATVNVKEDQLAKAPNDEKTTTRTIESEASNTIATQTEPVNLEIQCPKCNHEFSNKL